jgi:hypothetical protein
VTKPISVARTGPKADRSSLTPTANRSKQSLGLQGGNLFHLACQARFVYLWPPRTGGRCQTEAVTKDCPGPGSITPIATTRKS